ncbi:MULTISPECIES: lycopene beta cyclase [Prochlorococcus]|uniref:Lycopene epsilon cyclase n=1 Tax=Prochlorococcus marinus (strain SARG / CCMP1375 / SS120) TaxID=167539 RepID=Q7VCF0_PROMA|nr:MULTISPECIES: lycopene cyclase family protein [Prochlorococcus]AAP99834.1 Lycopene epsilon cyclase [Prochlorococcus marinus subsp. marinus str. CCMP1375]KGG11819.1 Lycopene epsilon cyclase [Prochlorococcus marinus str. LG]KGG21874.1 Lycopene epsilon cyclase [Prochlorococcus marinus str. SS2]KGG23695.1 Lycopene epsilon cyclase [Prochlorococcus marinus str. SS35]KGG35240.1 Lycopene epsilon cyclase [Prochlorococcus sp. SS52]
MSTNDPPMDVLVLGSGPGALAIAAALGQEKLRVGVLSINEPSDPWPFTYGIWGEEVDQLGLEGLLKHRWSKTVSYLGDGSTDQNSPKNNAIKHNRDYGLFDKNKLQKHWIDQCNEGAIKWFRGEAYNLEIDNITSSVKTIQGERIIAKLIIDATGYEPVFLNVPKNGEIAVQTCYGIVGEFSEPPVEKNQFVLMDYRSNHLSQEEKEEPPTFLYAMDMGNGKYFLEETSLGLAPPVKLETLKARLHARLKQRKIEIKKIDHEENGVFLPMNIPIPDLNQSILGFGGAAGMVHPASGYLVGALLRRAPSLAKELASAIKDSNKSPSEIAKQGWETLWPKELRRKQALYQFGLEKLMRFPESQLRYFFKSFFSLSNNQWYGFLTNTLTLNQLVAAMWTMFKKAPLNVKWGLMEMKGRELKLLWDFVKPSI